MSKGHGNPQKGTRTNSSNRPRQNDRPAQDRTPQTPQQNDSIARSVCASNQPKKKWYQSWEWWKRVIETVGAGAVLWYAVVTHYQWRDSHNAFLADERPYIKADIGRPPIAAETPIKLDWQATNTGKTPASTVHSQLEVEIVPHTQEPRL